MRAVLCTILAVGQSMAAPAQVAIAPGLRERAAQLDELCRAGEAQACFDAATLYWTGRASGWVDDARAKALIKAGVSLGPSRAVESQRRSCYAGDGNACTILAAMYEYGEGHEPDAATAAALYRRGCDSGAARGCFVLADMLSKGDGVPLDTAQASRLAAKICDGGFGPGCEMLANMGVSRGPAQPGSETSEKLFEQACSAGVASSCFTLGYAAEKARKDLIGAAGFYRRACNGGSAPGCVGLLRVGGATPK